MNVIPAGDAETGGFLQAAWTQTPENRRSRVFWEACFLNGAATEGSRVPCF